MNVSTTGGTEAADLPGDRRVYAMPASEIKPESVRWLWRHRVPLRGVTLLAGKPGLGKSTLAIRLAADLSRGQLDGDLAGTATDTLLVSFEDPADSVVRPRLEAAAADLERVHVVSAAGSGFSDLVSLPADLDAIGGLVRERSARLLIVDPFVAALSGDIDGHRDQDVRRALAPLAQLAATGDLAVLAVMHLNKAQGIDALARISGSVGFGGAARSAIMFGADPDDPEGEEGPARVVVPTKANWSKRGGLAVRCRIEGRVLKTGETSCLVLGEECDTRSEDVLREGEGTDRSAVDEAADFLLDELADGVWHPSREIKGKAKTAGHSARTLKRAKQRLGIEDRREGFPSVSEWRLIVGPSPVGPTVGPDGGPTRETRMIEPKTEGRPLSGATPTDKAQLDENGFDPDEELERLRAKQARWGEAA